jgi:23S rRNA pseudouridine955/2504/2580 synthase
LEDRNDPLNLLGMARNIYPDAQACHRLDKDTSGVIIFAKHADAYRHLSMQFEHRVVKKIYHAVVDGLHNFNDETVEVPIQKFSDGTVAVSPKGKSAKTHFKTLKSFKLHSLIECRPVTGRMHQIRLHLTVLGAPITGDLQYGGKEFFLSSIKRGFNLKKTAEEQPLVKRMALNAQTIEFSILDNSPVTIAASYPKDFAALVRQLELNS